MKTATSWKRVLALGCSHGIYADPDAIAAVLKFKAQFKPDYTIHLGDAIDCTAFMSSTVRDGSGDPIEPDVDGGLRFLRQLRPTHFLLGNHEHRLHRLIHSKHELVRFAAAKVLDGIKEKCRALKCRMIPYTGNSQELIIGNVRFMHGTVYSENATRDHAESYAPWKGSVVHAHTHRAGMATGRRADSPLGFSVGTLTQRDALEYANTRRATLSWSQAFVWGYVSDNSSQLFLCQKQAKEWRLP